MMLRSSSTPLSPQLDYCNALLIGIPSNSIQKLQHIQNSAARILIRGHKYEQITPILQSLHWLPISARIEYKVSLLTHQCIHGNTPLTLKNSLLHRSQHVPSAPQTLIVSSPIGLRPSPLGIEPFAPSPLACGMPFLNI